MSLDPVLIAATFITIHSFVRKLLPDAMVKGILFGGEIQEPHKTEFAVSKLVERYKESIDAVNKAFLLNIAFVVLALFPFLGLVEGTSIKFPFLDISVSVSQWIKVCPLISYGLQLYTFVNLVWFLLLRRGLSMLKEDLGQEKYFGDVSNILLTGFVGILWLFGSIYYYFRSKLQYIWLLPVVVLVSLIAMSPTLLCGYFIIKLYSFRNTYLAIFYSLLFIPSFVLSLVLITIGGLLSLQQEPTKKPKVLVRTGSRTIEVGDRVKRKD